ncbi:DUF2254 domain-containing protein (plasmid) [Paracoccus liaowanqingii]|uniref:DUF2254 domain-containing protein n=1 Tax=Paracoccus liaowanqingii TaxID=2560053 RepID=A0A4Y5SVY7_9RHOB|nr:DUF2254 domain-containing protein [Paracoccus liaowanqingii]QDA36924.1 DUF2254 domain-containing protein [Paracoccus liaowanqingii]
MTRTTLSFPGGDAVRAVWDSVRTSLWFLPSLMGGVAPILVIAAIAADTSLGQGGGDSFPRLVYVSQPDEARDFLATILTSMITMASLVFSITMVVLTLAASQFGPRLIRSFMGRLQTQFVLGAFVLTIIYCLLLLASLASQDEAASSAYLSVTIATVLTVISVALLVLYIHVLANSIISESLIEAVGQELDQGIAQLPPLGQADDPEAALPEDFADRAAFHGTKRSGYVQAIDFERLTDLAKSHDVIVGLHLRAGNFAVQDGRCFGIYPEDRATEDLARRIAGTIRLGVHRTPAQDLEFSIRHLVEIAVRALSPGINDPYTAVAVIHRLSASWSQLLGKAVPPGVFRDEDGQPRVICPRPTYALLLNASFSQIRQNSTGVPLVIIQLLKSMHAISFCVRTSEQRTALREQVDAVLEDARRTIPNSEDLKDIEQHGRTARDALGECAPGERV